MQIFRYFLFQSNFYIILSNKGLRNELLLTFLYKPYYPKFFDLILFIITTSFKFCSIIIDLLFSSIILS